MTTTSFEGLTGDEIQAIGDEQLRAGAYDLARATYAAALRKGPATPAMVTRHGLAASPTDKTLLEFEVLQAVERLGVNVFVGRGIATWFKPLPFYADQKFLETAARHANLLGLPNWHWNLNTVLWAVEEARGVEGDFVELGVFKGHTTLFCAEYVGFQDWPKRWWLYDTFDGIPEDQMDPGWAEINRAYRNSFSFEEVQARFAAFPNIGVHKGRAPEILAEASPEKIAFIHMDLNNAAAEIASLDALFDRLSPGGIIIFDDYGWATTRAQNQAEEAWFAARGLRVLTLPTGQGLFRKV